MDNKEYERLRYIRDKYKRDECHRKYSQTLAGRLAIWKSGARNGRRNLEFSLTLSDLEKIPLKCAYSGVDLTLERNRPNSASLDRIDNTKGYIPGNVCFCTLEINLMKKNHSVTKFLELCKMVHQHNKEVSANATNNEKDRSRRFSS